MSALVASFWLVGSAAAQSLPQLPDSAVIRISAPDVDLKSERATFLAWQTDALRAIHIERGDTLQLAFPSITRLDLLQGKNVGLGMLRGAAFGGAIGGLIGLPRQDLAIRAD